MVNEASFVFVFLFFIKHQTLIYLYMQRMMNGYQQEYDSLPSVKGAKILCDEDYILE